MTPRATRENPESPLQKDKSRDMAVTFYRISDLSDNGSSALTSRGEPSPARHWRKPSALHFPLSGKAREIAPARPDRPPTSPRVGTGLSVVPRSRGALRPFELEALSAASGPVPSTLLRAESSTTAIPGPAATTRRDCYSPHSPSGRSQRISVRVEQDWRVPPPSGLAEIARHEDGDVVVLPGHVLAHSVNQMVADLFHPVRRH